MADWRAHGDRENDASCRHCESPVESTDDPLCECDGATIERLREKLDKANQLTIDISHMAAKLLIESGKQLSETDDVVADIQEDFRTVVRAVKKKLGLKNWPEFEGHFADGVAALLGEKPTIQELNAYLVNAHSENISKCVILGTAFNFEPVFSPELVDPKDFEEKKNGD